MQEKPDKKIRFFTKIRLIYNFITLNNIKISINITNIIFVIFILLLFITYYIT